jgi:aspartyl-tRNA synthetase
LDLPEDWRRTHYSKDIDPSMEGRQVTINGWVREIRDLGGIVFVLLRDGKGLVQVTASKKDTPPESFKIIKGLAGEYIVAVKGSVRASPQAPRGLEILPLNVKIIAKASHPLPIDTAEKVPADIDTRLNARILDLRRREPNAIFRIRHEVLKAIRDYLYSEGFIEVQTPRIIAAAAEGGASLFELKYFDRTAYLAQSPELYKEKLTTVFEKVFEIGPFFRAEESHSRRHLNEFTSVDVESAFADYRDVMRLQEQLLHRIGEHISKSCREELETINVHLKPPKIPFKRYTYSEILDELEEANCRINWGEDISTEAYRRLGELHKGEYYFITDWPTSTRPFYIKPRSDDPKVSYGFDTMYGWIEVASGGSRIDEKEALIKRLKEQNLNVESFKFFLDVFDYGMPPHAGWGMGLERLLMGMLKKNNIREVVLFPRDRFRLFP